IVLDPPAFAKSKSAIDKALSGYKEINLRALKLLNAGGFLVTCSCSYHVNEASFAEVIFDASLDAKTEVSVVEKRMQGRDHPVVLGMPETYYLKCFILRKLAYKKGGGVTAALHVLRLAALERELDAELQLAHRLSRAVDGPE